MLVRKKEKRIFSCDCCRPIYVLLMMLLMFRQLEELAIALLQNIDPSTDFPSEQQQQPRPSAPPPPSTTPEVPDSVSSITKKCIFKWQSHEKNKLFNQGSGQSNGPRTGFTFLLSYVKKLNKNQNGGFIVKILIGINLLRHACNFGMRHWASMNNCLCLQQVLMWWITKLFSWHCL